MSQPSSGISFWEPTAGLDSKRYKNSGICKTAVITASIPDLKSPPVSLPTCQIDKSACDCVASTGRRNALPPKDEMNVVAHACSPAAAAGSHVRTLDKRL